MEHMDWNGIIEMLLGQYIAHWTNNPNYVQIVGWYMYELTILASLYT